MKEIKIKEWFYDKMEAVSRNYNMFIDVTEASRVDGKITANEDGYLEVIVEQTIKETEKAIQVVLSTGWVIGSTKGWKCWIPKSVIK